MFFRLLALVLVFANLIFYAWTQDYLGAFDKNHESQRLNQQLNADKLRIVRMDQQSAAARDEAGCRLVSGLNLAEAEALKLTAESAGAITKLLPQAEPPLYLVLIGDLANKAAADKKAAELIRFGVKEFNTVQLDGGKQEIILGSFKAEDAAAEFLAGLEKLRIKSALLERRDAPVLKARVEARAQASVLQQLPSLITPYPNAKLSVCAE